MSEAPKHGTIGWHDIAVPQADVVRDFYSSVCGWSFEPLSMGDYDDYVMKASDGSAVAGVCWKKGPNADLPTMWFSYVNVDSLDAALVKVTAGGGRVVRDPRGSGAGMKMALIADPAGAILALYGPISG